jgi:hypothetical protein
MKAPERFVQWMTDHRHVDPKLGLTYRYHSRSDAHSIELCSAVVVDLVDRCALLREQAAIGVVAYGINLKHRWASGKSKTLDLAVGTPVDGPILAPPANGIHRVTDLDEVLIACEAKTVMTEHSKAQPRIFDELSSSHEIVHSGRPDAIAAGITVVNIAATFVSPLRQQEGRPLYVTHHKQPHVTDRMVKHLRGLVTRERPEGVGFDAYCTIVVNCDNQGGISLCTDQPAPQPGDHDHYDTFIERIATFYTERFATLR